MFTFHHLLTGLQAAIAVVSARDRTLTAFLVAVWGRVGRMRTRLEKLIILWRAGMLPKPLERASVAGAPSDGRVKNFNPPTQRGWLIARVPAAAGLGAGLESMLTEAECVRFLAEVPQARRIVRALHRMLVAEPGKPPPKLKRVEVWPPAAWQEAVRQAGMRVGPTGRLVWN